MHSHWPQRCRGASDSTPSNRRGDVFFQTKAAAFFSAMALNALPMWRKRAARMPSTKRGRLIGEPAITFFFQRARERAMENWQLQARA